MGTRGKSIYINQEIGKHLEQLAEKERRWQGKFIPQCKLLEHIIKTYTDLDKRLNGHTALLSDDSLTISFYLDKEMNVEIFSSGEA